MCCYVSVRICQENLSICFLTQEPNRVYFPSALFQECSCNDLSETGNVALKNIFCFCCKLRPASYKTFSKHFQEKKKILLRSLEYLLQSLITCLCASACKLEEQCTYRDKNTGEQRQNRDVPKSRDYSRRECQGF